MPWEIRRNYGGCSGYAVVKKPDGEIEGCHSTVAAAESQMRALYASEGEMGGPGIKMSKMIDPQNIFEGDFAMGSVDEEIYVGQIVHIMTEGMLGVEGSKKTIMASPNNPAILIRIFEQHEDGYWKETYMFTGFDAMSGMKIDPLPMKSEYFQNGGTEKSLDKEVVTNQQTPNKNPQGASASVTYEKIDKATSLDALDLKPTESMANNARRGLELRRKFGRGGTAVGVARARDLANRKELSPETVARMYSFFSRHEVDKKGKDFNNPERPSNGKIAWLLWGGDSGYAWARSKWGAIQRIRAQKSENAMWKDSALSLEKFIDIPE